jgi:hypothetical protein
VRWESRVDSRRLETVAGELTTPAVAVPAAPTDLKVTVVWPTQLNLTWTGASDNADGFRLECKTGDTGLPAGSAQAGEWKPVMRRTPANWPSFTDYGLEPGRTHAYRVRAFNAAGESAWSNEVTASTATIWKP